MNKIIAVLCTCLIFAGCNNTHRDNRVVESEIEDTAYIPDMHTAANSLDYYGSYTGTLPAADAPGMQTALTLKSDNTYVLESVFVGHEDQIFEEKGRYTIDDNVITLKSDHGDDQYYKVSEGYLLKLDNNKNEITGDLANDYRLNKE